MDAVEAFIETLEQPLGLGETIKVTVTGTGDGHKWTGEWRLGEASEA